MSGPDHTRASLGSSVPGRLTDVGSDSSQTSSPTPPDTLAAAISSIPVHDHLCLIYGSRSEQFATVVPFIRRGLDLGERCVYIADENTADVVLAALRDAGIDVDDALGHSALTVLSKRESYLRDGRFDPDEMIAFLGEAAAAALADGFSALCVTGEMTWVLGGEPGTERLFEYEARLNRFFPGHAALALCQYSRARFSPEAIRNVIRTHPVVIADDTVCDNPYYVPTDDFLQAGQAQAEVDRMLEGIVASSRTRRALKRESAAWTATFDAMNDLVCLLDRHGTIERCNAAMQAYLGLAADQAAGQTCHELMHGSPTFLEQCPFTRMLESGKRESVEIPLRDRWYQITADPLVNDVSEITGAVHIVRDVTDRKRIEDDLRDSEARARFWSEIVERAADAVAIGYPDGRIGDCNQAWCDLTGYSREELRSIDWATDLTPPEWLGPERESLAELERTGRPVRYEKEIIRRDESRVRVELVVHLQSAPDGSDVHYTGFVRDVTDRRLAEEHIRDLNEKLERRVAARAREIKATNRELQELVYSVAHDLRTPLRAVDGFSLAVMETHGEALGEEGRADLERVRTAAQRLGRVIDGLVSLANVGSRAPRTEETDLSAIAREVVAELRDGQPERQVEVTIEDGLVVQSDSLLAEVVLANLLGNAWKFTSREPAAHIEVGTLVQDGRQAFYVRDDGVGFDPAYAHKLFTPFESLHGPEGFPGTGIGLATVARILESLGGTCWAEGRPGEGATFYFVIAGPDSER